MMNTTVAIEQSTPSTSATGVVTRTWSTLIASIPARVRDMTGQLLMKYGRPGATDTDLFYFATDPGIDGNVATRRIVYNGKAYYPSNSTNSGGQLNRLWAVAAEQKALQKTTAG